MKHQKMIGTVLTVCVLLLTLAGCASTSTSTFDGSSAKNADSYKLDVKTMNCTDTHTLELNQGDALQIQFETKQGDLSMEITAPDGTAIYQGDGTEATQFTLDVPADGAYTISVEGKKAQGSIHVDVVRTSEATEPTETMEPETVAVTAEELVGPWHLEPGENDEAAINESFPGAMEFGNNMEITGDGNISWYIGAEGGSGTYTLDGDTLHTEITSDLDESAMTLDLKVERTDGALSLFMEVKDLSLRWSQDEGETGKGEEDDPEKEGWKTALEEELLEKYGVTTEYYEDLGDGIYQVYVEVGGEVVPFVTVDSATGDYHG